MDVMQQTPDFMQVMEALPMRGLTENPPTAGIIAEYNPFHKGHQWMVQQLRRGGVANVVCVMSGAFVQRAEPGMLPTHLRARAALAGGVDLVLRLPVPWAVASAEGFAQGGASLLAALGCVDMLAFGAETPVIGRLTEVAQLLGSAAFGSALRAELAKGVSFATARAAAAEHLLPGARQLLREPNNILGIEYIKAMEYAVPEALRARMPEHLQNRVVAGLFGRSSQMEDLFMLPLLTALPRAGAMHDGEPAGGYASASWLRAQVQEKGMEALRPWVPEECMYIYKAAQGQGAVIDQNRWEVAMLSRLRKMDAETFARHPGAGEGLEARLAQAARQATSLEELYTRAKTKRFAHSRVRRLALGAALGLPARLPVLPPFAQVLAANGRGLALLRRAKQCALLPVSTSLARLAQTGEEAGRVAALEAAAEDLHALCLKKPLPSGGAYTQPAAMLARAF